MLPCTSCKYGRFPTFRPYSIKNVFKPDKSFVFPKNGGRSFLYKWLEEYSWLCYSPSVDGALCLPCVLFGDQSPAKKHKVKRLFLDQFPIGLMHLFASKDTLAWVLRHFQNLVCMKVQQINFINWQDKQLANVNQLK